MTLPNLVIGQPPIIHHPAILPALQPANETDDPPAKRLKKTEEEKAAYKEQRRLQAKLGMEALRKRKKAEKEKTAGIPHPSEVEGSI